MGEQLTAWKATGIDGFTLSAPANGHLPERVALLGEVATRVMG
ncbi:MAG: hypothetical protein ACKO04_16815 [Actinomycetes bacterium]